MSSSVLLFCLRERAISWKTSFIRVYLDLHFRHKFGNLLLYHFFHLNHNAFFHNDHCVFDLFSPVCDGCYLDSKKDVEETNCSPFLNVFFHCEHHVFDFISLVWNWWLCCVQCGERSIKMLFLIPLISVRFTCVMKKVRTVLDERVKTFWSYIFCYHVFGHSLFLVVRFWRRHKLWIGKFCVVDL